MPEFDQGILLAHSDTHSGRLEVLGSRTQNELIIEIDPQPLYTVETVDVVLSPVKTVEPAVSAVFSVKTVETENTEHCKFSDSLPTSKQTLHSTRSALITSTNI